jgi:cytidylate kinase
MGSMRTPRSVQALVDEHVGRWSLERRAADPTRRAPCIALSRLPGSGGAELGQRVAERIGYSFFGIEIVDRIARERKIQRELVVGLDEHVRTVIDRYVLDALRPFNEGDYLHQVVRTLVTIAETGGAVFLGRGAAFILPPERTLRLLVTAPRDLRVERMAKTHDLSSRDASARIEHEEESRRDFHRHHFKIDPDDPSHYDLVTNIGTLGIDDATELVVAAWQRRFDRQA